MTFQDFHNIQSGHNVTAELLKWLIFGIINFLDSIETSVNCRLFTAMQLRADILFQKQIHLFKSMLNSFIHAAFAFRNCLLWCSDRFVSGAVCNTKLSRKL